MDVVVQRRVSPGWAGHTGTLSAFFASEQTLLWAGVSSFNAAAQHSPARVPDPESQ